LKKSKVKRKVWRAGENSPLYTWAEGREAQVLTNQKKKKKRRKTSADKSADM
jgi:hypothetical protein